MSSLKRNSRRRLASVESCNTATSQWPLENALLRRLKAPSAVGAEEGPCCLSLERSFVTVLGEAGLKPEVHFGHENWNMVLVQAATLCKHGRVLELMRQAFGTAIPWQVLSMMIGIRMSVGRSGHAIWLFLFLVSLKSCQVLLQQTVSSLQ